MRIFRYTFETHKRSFISAFSICMTVPLRIFPVHVTAGTLDFVTFTRGMLNSTLHFLCSVCPRVTSNLTNQNQLIL